MSQDEVVTGQVTGRIHVTGSGGHVPGGGGQGPDWVVTSQDQVVKSLDGVSWSCQDMVVVMSQTTWSRHRVMSQSGWSCHRAGGHVTGEPGTRQMSHIMGCKGSTSRDQAG